MRLIEQIRQRFADWKLERQIAGFAAATQLHQRAGQPDLAREAWDAHMAARGQRSDAQLTRLAIAELRRFPELARLQMQRAERESADA